MASQPTQKITEEEYQRRDRRKYAYHLVAAKNKLPSDPEEEEDDQLFRHLTSSTLKTPNQTLVQDAKTALLRELARSGGDVTSSAFSAALERLTGLYELSMFDARVKPHKSNSRPKGKLQLEGMWLAVSKPNFKGCLGLNANREYLYTLGRMSFDMFHPTDLVCSIQGTFNPIHYVKSKDRKELKWLPKSLKAELEYGYHVLRSFDIVTAFTIEPRNPKFGPTSPNNASRPIEGLMTTYGFVVPNPEYPNRLSVWWTSGTLEVTDDYRGWRKVFNSDSDTKQKPKPKERKKLFGPRLVEKSSNKPTPPEIMEEDGRMSYKLETPIGGRETYSDLLYLDETLRIDRSSSGVIHVAARVPSFTDE